MKITDAVNYDEIRETVEIKMHERSSEYFHSRWSKEIENVIKEHNIKEGLLLSHKLVEHFEKLYNEYASSDNLLNEYFRIQVEAHHILHSYFLNEYAKIEKRVVIIMNNGGRGL